MRALCRAGRPADALAEYRRLRPVLHDELGIEPGTRLQDLHRRILSGEIAAAEPDAATPIAPVRSLPRSAGDFTGREALSAGVLDHLAGGGEGPVVEVDRRDGRGSARPRWLCTWPRGWATATRTRTCSSTCTGTATGSGWNRRPPWSRCCASSASSPSGCRPDSTTGPPCGAARWPAGAA